MHYSETVSGWGVSDIADWVPAASLHLHDRDGNIKKNLSAMSIRKTPWKWTKARELAARLVAEDRLPDRGIAEQADVSQPTIYVWRAKPEFMVRVDELVAAYRKRSGRASIAAVEKRIANMVRDLDLLDQVDAERARVYGSDRFRDAVPGGATGKVIVTSYQVITDPRTGRKQEAVLGLLGSTAFLSNGGKLEVAQ